MRERERDIDLLFHLFMHSLVDSWMCPDWGLNPQPWGTGRTLEPAEPPARAVHRNPRRRSRDKSV